MTFFTTLRKEKDELLRIFHLAIVQGIMDAWERTISRGNIPQEPDVVASLVKVTTPIIYESIKNILNQYGINISVFSVYCHQTPKVKYDNMRKTSCELGDLLVIHTHTNVSNHMTQNALLYQAKMSSDQPHRVSSKEMDQLILYTRWPDFCYHNSGTLNGIKRVVKPKAPHSGAQYMLVDDRGPASPESGLLLMPGTYPIGSCMPDIYIHDHSDLATELFNFMMFRSGRSFEEYDKCVGNQDWSELIWDLINVGVKKGFTRKRSDWINVTKMSQYPLEEFDGLCFAMTTSPSVCNTIKAVLGDGNTTFLFSGESGEPPREYRQNRERPTPPQNGISLIMIETSEIGRNPFDDDTSR